jgi:hypothetical protein
MNTLNNRRRLIQPSNAIVLLWADYLAADRRKQSVARADLTDKLLASRALSLSDLAIKAHVLKGDVASGIKAHDVDKLCADILRLCRRQRAAARRNAIIR